LQQVVVEVPTSPARGRRLQVGGSALPNQLIEVGSEVGTAEAEAEAEAVGESKWNRNVLPAPTKLVSRRHRRKLRQARQRSQPLQYWLWVLMMWQEIHKGKSFLAARTWVVLRYPLTGSFTVAR